MLQYLLHMAESIATGILAVGNTSCLADECRHHITLTFDQSFIKLHNKS